MSQLASPHPRSRGSPTCNDHSVLSTRGLSLRKASISAGPRRGTPRLLRITRSRSFLLLVVQHSPIQSDKDGILASRPLSLPPHTAGIVGQHRPSGCLGFFLEEN